MSEWKECKIADAPFEIIDGDRGTNYPKQDEFNQNGYCLFLNAKNVTIDGFAFDECYFISKEKDEILRKGKLRRNDIVLTTRGTVGNIGFFNERIPYEHIRINSGMVIIRPDPEGILSEYTHQLFKYLKGDFDVFATGSAQPQLPIRDLKEISFSLPPIPEQRAIAGVLSSLDDKIDLLHRQNKTLEGIAEALWRKMFVEEADPGWDEKGLDEIATFLNGLPCQKYPPDTSAGPLPVIKIKELRTGITDDSDLATSKAPPDYIIDDGDILFSWSGSIEVVIWSFGKGVLNQHLFKVTSVDYPKWFCYYWIKHHLAEFRDIAQDKATTMGHIQRHHLSAAKVLIPDGKSFEYLNKQIAPLFEKMAHNLKAIRKLARLRDTLLPKLMSGEVRVRI